MAHLLSVLNSNIHSLRTDATPSNPAYVSEEHGLPIALAVNLVFLLGSATMAGIRQNA